MKKEKRYSEILENGDESMSDDILLNKASIIERCLKRIEEEYQENPLHLSDNLERQDSIILNLQRACEASIDMAMHLVRKKKLGIPQESRDAFDLLFKAGVISESLSLKLQSMVGFRNIAVHDYQSLNLEVVQSIIEKHLNDFREWISVGLQQSS